MNIIRPYSYDAYINLFNRKVKGTSHPFYNDRYIRNYQNEISKIKKGSLPKHKKNSKIMKLVQKKEKRIQNLLFEHSLNSHKYLTASGDLWGLEKIHSKGGRTVYKSNNDVCWKLATQYAQIELEDYFDLYPRDRNYIVSCLKDVLKTKSNIIIIRYDIKNFYETVNTKAILESSANEGISELTKHLISTLIHEYSDLSESNKGLPQGVALSSTLSELAIKNFDRNVQKFKGLLYYGRYVDDMVFVFNDSIQSSEEAEVFIQNELNNVGFQISDQSHKKAIIKSNDMDYISILKEEIECHEKEIATKERNKESVQEHNPCNIEKIRHLQNEIDTLKQTIAVKEGKISKYKTCFDYLGYKIFYSFKGGKNQHKFAVGIPDSKIESIKTNINQAFYLWQVEIARASRRNARERAKVDKLLLRRINLLSSNYKLDNRKSLILVGLYGSYKSICEEGIDALANLDIFFQKVVDDNSHNLSGSKNQKLILRKLKSISFQKSFREKKFFNVKPADIKEIKRGWI